MYVKGKSSCETALKTLMDYAKKKGGNAVFIDILPPDCVLGKFQSFAMRCK
jgi:hypothetical protein